ncbi:MAG: Hsp70 family protein, partial [Actinobacteria bacterium]|nr:Hsp70 family protein [Actinomycetota bacterium]
KREAEHKLEAVKRLFATEDFVDVGGQRVSVEEAAALLFGHLRAASPGVTVDRAVVTIPANSRGAARFRTKLCAGLAGIEVQALLNEPTAAAMAYSVDATRDQNVLVFDWGGGTLDVTVLETIEGVFIERASKGIPRSGGIDLDEAFGAAIIAELPSRPAWSPAQQTQFRLEVEHAKILLSSRPEVTLSLPDDGYFTATRELLLKAIGPHLETIRAPIERCFADLSIGPRGIDTLVMVGGSSKIPAARDMVSEILQREPATGCDPMTAVAQGAAIASAILLGQLDKDFFVATEHALGTIVHNERDRPQFSVLIPRNHQLPAKATDSYLPASEGQEEVLVRVIEGDPGKAVDHEENVVLKEWTIAVDPARSRADNAFTITYEYNVDGILHITVIDQLTGRQMLRDDVSFGLTKDRAQLVELAKRVRTTVDTGSVGLPARAAPRSTDPEANRLTERARTKVIPFVDEEEASRLEAICADLEHATGEGLQKCKEALSGALRQYAYLF